MTLDTVERAGPAERAERESADRALLAGPAAEHLLRAVLEAEGVTLTSWSLHQVQHRPGVGVTAGWSVHWALDGREGEEYLLGTTCPVPAGTAGATTAVLAGRELVVWRHPADPALPGLPRGSDRERLSVELGLDPGSTGLELVTYRPLRRAVLRLTGTVAGRPRTTYLKVVRPDRADGLVRRHGTMTAAGVPAARVADLGEGVLALAGLPGRPLTDLLAADGAVGVAPGAVLRLLDRLPGSLTGLPLRPSWTDRLAHHADAAAAAVPEHAGEIRSLAARVEELLATTDPGPVVPTHGDLHEANLLVSGGDVVGLLDVDTAGPGHRVDDLACLLGHMSVLPCLAPEVHRHVPGVLPGWTAALEVDVDPVGLRARAAAVVLSLVAGARREDGRPWRADAAGRVGVAARWLDEAGRLRGLSSPRQTPLTRTGEGQVISATTGPGPAGSHPSHEEER